MDVYRERAYLVAHLASIYPSALVFGADPDEPTWPVLFVSLPTGQASWHISPDDTDLFHHVDLYETSWPSAPVWDGHSTGEKYGRLATATADIFDRKARV